jgi:hypothetical protein
MHLEAQDSLTIADIPLVEHEVPQKDEYSPLETIEIAPGKTLKINRGLNEQQKVRLIQVLQKHVDAFSWSYTDMKGIHHDLCTHHIYIKEGS